MRRGIKKKIAPSQHEVRRGKVLDGILLDINSKIIKSNKILLLAKREINPQLTIFVFLNQPKQQLPQEPHHKNQNTRQYIHLQL